MKDSVFRQVRYALYLTLVLSGILVQWFMPYDYRCNITGQQCFACGLRTAVDLVLQGRLAEAYQANPLIAAVLLIGMVMALDVAHGLRQRRRAKQPRR